MKKKLKQSVPVLSEEETPGQQAADYEVGAVSGSLFQKSSAASGSSLSALFCTAAPTTQLLFQPAPEPVRRSAEEQDQQNEAAEVKGQGDQKKKKKKPLKEKSEAEERLEDRESGLTNADEHEEGQQTGKQKKKRKAPEPDEGNSVEQWVLKRQKMRERKQEEATKRSRTVFVGNLPIGCTKKTLLSLFREKGSVESIRFRSVVREDPSISKKVAVIQRKVHPKKQSINAYVVFKDEEGVLKALERNGMEIQKDFHIRVDRVTDSSLHDHKRSVFVGNLSFEINELSFRRHFEECGPVEGVRLVRDKNSGLGKGFGYVLFEGADSVQLALELDGSKLEGRSVRVKRSMKKEKLKKTDSKGTAGRDGKGPAKGPMRGQMRDQMKGGPMRGAGRGRGGSLGGSLGGGRGGGRGGGLGGSRGGSRGDSRGSSRGGFKSSKKFFGDQQRATKSPGSFKGEMTTPNKTKKKGLKKKPRSNRTVHI